MNRHFSGSQIISFFMCAHDYYESYMLRNWMPPSTAMIRGISFHKLPEINNRQKITSKVDLPVSDMKDIVSDEVEAGFKEDLFLNADEKFKTKPAVKGEIKDMLVGLAPVYARESKDIMPRDVETLQAIKIPGTDRIIKYKMDIETEDDQIIDYKTTSKKKNQKDADSDIKLTIYSLAFYAKNKKLPDKTSLHNFIGHYTPARNELKTDFQEIVTDRNNLDFKTLIKRIEYMDKSVKAGIFPPAEIGHWKCGPKYCARFPKCPYVNAERVSAAQK